jgi:cell wall-associated NlpC family hydrolase
MRSKLAGRGRFFVAFLGGAATVGVAVVVVAGGGGSSLAGSASGGQEVNLDPAALAQLRRSQKAQSGGDGARPQLVVALPPGTAAAAPERVPASAKGARAQTDAELRRDLSLFRTYLATIPPTTGRVAQVISSGEAAAPFDAPPVVIRVVQAANEIARTPYRWGGGHSGWRDKGYDCSGSISFALAAAGLLDAPLTSGMFETYGDPGPGRWITIYANGGHAFMTVAGLRFDTGGLRTGTRWQSSMRPTGGFVPRHPSGF